MTAQRRAPVSIHDKMLLTLSETAEVLSLGESTLRELIRAGELLPVRFGTAVRIRRADLERYVAELQPDRQIAELPEWIQELAQGRR